MSGVEKYTEVRPDDAPQDSSSFLSPVRSALDCLRSSRVAVWGRFVSGTAMSVSGVVAGTYVLRNLQRPTGWALMYFSIGAAGVYITGRSLYAICNLTTLNSGEEAPDCEIVAYQESSPAQDGEIIDDRSPFEPRSSPVILPRTWKTTETSKVPRGSLESPDHSVPHGRYRPKSMLSAQLSENRHRKHNNATWKEGQSSASTVFYPPEPEEFPMDPLDPEEAIPENPPEDNLPRLLDRTFIEMFDKKPKAKAKKPS